MPRWLRSYFLMLKWQILSSRAYLSLMVAVQIMIAAGFIFGISFFYPSITPDIAVPRRHPANVRRLTGLLQVECQGVGNKRI